jgi:hypothetical protein
MKKYRKEADKLFMGKKGTKKHQKAGYQRYLTDAMAESNETQVGLCQCRDFL